MNIQKIRRLFPVTKYKVFLNHAGESPLPLPVSRAIKDCVAEGTRGEFMIDKQLANVKKTFGNLIGAKPEELAFVPNTSYGINAIATILNVEGKQRNVVVNQLEYPSNIYPWLRLREKDVKVKWAPVKKGQIDPVQIGKLVDNNTLAVAISHVQWCNGFRSDLEHLADIAHEHNALLVVDAIQSAGALHIDVQKSKVDFLTCACYKWLLGPAGIGFLYVRRNLLKRLEPLFVGWASVDHGEDENADLYYAYNKRKLKFHPDARRFEIGTSARANILGADAAMKLIAGLGIAKVQRRIFELTDLLVDKLSNLKLKVISPRGTNQKSGIVTFRVKDPETLSRRLFKRKFHVVPRMGGIRVSPHFYNNEEEIHSFVETLKMLNA